MSGIYIPGMEMPKEDEISKCLLIRHDGEVWVVEFDNLISDLGYVACYPTNPAKAIPVPDHGRLIDVDALIDELPNNLGIRGLEYLNRQESAIISWIRAVPTIIPADIEQVYGDY